MNTGDIVELAMVFSLVVVPALGITARIVLKPIVDAMVRLREGGVLPTLGAAKMENEFLHLREELRQMRDEMAQLQGTMSGLKDAEDFSRALREPAPPQPMLPTTDA
jgi:hypothetical protein